MHIGTLWLKDYLPNMPPEAGKLRGGFPFLLPSSEAVVVLMQKESVIDVGNIFP